MLDSYTWIEPDGTSTAVDESTGAVPLFGAQGAGPSPVTHRSRKVHGQAGEVIEHTRRDSAIYDLPITYEADSPENLRTVMRDWAWRLDPTRGTGTLRRTSAATGNARERYVKLQETTRWDEGERLLGDWLDDVWTFKAADPYWYDTTDTIRMVDGAVSDPLTFFPLLPIKLAPSDLFGSWTETNAGQADAWPVWTITGPVDEVSIRNETTAKEVRLVRTLSATQYVTIDTRPGYKSVLGNGGENLFRYLTQRPMWPLVPGDNLITIVAVSATEDTSVQLSYRRRWLTP